MFRCNRNANSCVKLLQLHLDEMMSIIYTPTEGDAIQNYSRLFRRPEGCYLNIRDPDHVHHNLAQWGNPEDIDYIVVSGQFIVYIVSAATNIESRRRRNSRHW